MNRTDLAHIAPPPMDDDGRLRPYSIPLLPEFNLAADETDPRWLAGRAPVYCIVKRGGARGATLGQVKWDCEPAELVGTWGRGVYFVDVRDLGGAVVTQGMANLGEGLAGVPTGILSNLAEPAPPPPAALAGAADQAQVNGAPRADSLRAEIGTIAQGLHAVLAQLQQRPPDPAQQPVTVGQLQALLAQRAPAAPAASPMAQLGEMASVMASLQALTPTAPPPPEPVNPTEQLGELLTLMGQVREATTDDGGTTTASDAANKFLSDLPSTVREIVRATDGAQPGGSAGGLDALVYLMDQLGNDPASVGVVLARQVQSGQLPAAWLAGDVLEQACAALGGERALCLKGAANHARQLLSAQEAAAG